MKQAIENYRERAEKFCNEEFKRDYPEANDFILTVKFGRKYAKIIAGRKDRPWSDGVWAFIDMKNGDILKPAGWSKPAKHARGNINDESGGLSRVGWTGTDYLK